MSIAEVNEHLLPLPPGTAPPGGCRLAYLREQVQLDRLLRSVRDRRRGMTLIEIMVVITVLALMATAISVSVVKLMGKAKIGAAKGDISTLSTALDVYYADQGEYPAQGSGLGSLIEKGTDGSCFIKGCKLKKDPWKEDYIYRYPGTKNPEGFDVCSKGADKQEGTEDDICNGDTSS